MKNYIETYLVDNQERDLVIILPGGGYQRTSPREGIAVSKLLNDNGFHTAIYYYREELINLDELIAEAGELLAPIFMNELFINIYIIGFSAGGHLAGVLASHLTNNMISGVVFAYPVVSTKSNLIHKGSFQSLQVSKDDDINNYDLINYIHNDFPSSFIFHTGEDQSVNVLNSIELYQSLIYNDIDVELHIYNDGLHGMSLGTEEVAFDGVDPRQFSQDYKYQSNWTNLMIKWLKMKAGNISD